MPINKLISIKYFIVFCVTFLFSCTKSAFAECPVSVPAHIVSINAEDRAGCVTRDVNNYKAVFEWTPNYTVGVDGKIFRDYRVTEYASSSHDCSCSDAECFLPGTKITTPAGSKNIEDIKAGEKVLSFDPATQKISENIVASVIQTTKPSYYEITTKSGRVIKATAEHPFFVGFNQNPSFFPLVKIANLIDTLRQSFAKIANK